MKKYYRKGESQFIENGASKLRVGVLTEFTVPSLPHRVCKLMAVQEVMRTSPKNPIYHGQLIAVSFPEDKANAKEYVWGKYGPEPFQVEINVKLGKN